MQQCFILQVKGAQQETEGPGLGEVQAIQILVFAILTHAFSPLRFLTIYSTIGLKGKQAMAGDCAGREAALIDIDRFSAILDEQAALLPAEIYRSLNLGIGVVERHKRDRRSTPARPMYVLGEYHVHPVMGRGILLYYGSFCRVYPYMNDEGEARREIDRVLKHELTHHLENQAGSRELEIADAQYLMRWNDQEDQA